MKREERDRERKRESERVRVCVCVYVRVCLICVRVFFFGICARMYCDLERRTIVAKHAPTNTATHKVKLALKPEHTYAHIHTAHKTYANEPNTTPPPITDNAHS